MVSLALKYLGTYQTQTEAFGAFGAERLCKRLEGEKPASVPRPARGQPSTVVAYLNETRCTCIAAIAMLAVLVSVFGIAAPAWAQVEQSIVVLVNDDPITVYDVEQRQRFLAVTTQEQPSPALKKKATDMLIEERLQIQQARKLGITPRRGGCDQGARGHGEEQQYEPGSAWRGAGPNGREHQDAQGPHQVSGGVAGRGTEASSGATFRSPSPTSTRHSEVLPTPRRPRRRPPFSCARSNTRSRPTPIKLPSPSNSPRSNPSAPRCSLAPTSRHSPRT